MHTATKTILFVLLICILTIEARSRGDSDGFETDEQAMESEQRPSKETSRRKRQYYRQYYQRRHQIPPQYEPCQDLVEQQLTQRDILRKLDEVLLYVMNPPPPPPPSIRYVYLKYPVQRHRCNCTERPSDTVVNNRFPEIDDPRRNWGMAYDDNDYYEETFDRPLNFDGVDRTTQSPLNNRPVTQAPRDPDAAEANCFAAVLHCCYQRSPSPLRCLAKKGCHNRICSKQSTDAAIKFFAETYGSVQ